MSFPEGRYVGLDLGARPTAPGNLAGLNLGVAWTDDDGGGEPPVTVARGLRTSASLRWQPAAMLSLFVGSAWGQAGDVRVKRAAPWALAPLIARALVTGWGDAPHVSTQGAMAWHGMMPRRRAASALAWRTPPRERTTTMLAWSQQSLTRRAAALAWSNPPTTSRAATLPWSGLPQLQTRGATLRWLYPGLGKRAARIPWQQARQVRWLVNPPVTEPPTPPDTSPFPPGDRVGLNLGCAVIGIAGFAPLNLGVTACYVVRPTRKTYIVLNTISVVRLPDRTPIEVDSVGITGDAASWGYSLDMALSDPSQLPLLKPTASGPRQLEVTLNGYVWTFLAESYSTQREWMGGGVSITGRSRTALLAAPYAPARSTATTTARSVAQLATDELADTGYTLSYDTVDWVVPEGAWYYDSLTALDAVSRLAEASGAVVQSDPESLSLRVRPRYPASPWDWPTTTPDATIQDDILLSTSLQVRSVPLYDAVVVTGEITGKGVTAVIKRAGEAGTLYAAQASDQLISVAAAGAERGRNILSDRGEQASIDHVIPLFPADAPAGQTGRVLPLDLVEVQEADGTWQGLCTGISISARRDDKAVVIEQTVTLERHYSDAN